MTSFCRIWKIDSKTELFIFWISLVMFSFKSFKIFGNGLFTLDLRSPHWKQSHGFRPGDRVGHCFLVMNFSSNLSCNHSWIISRMRSSIILLEVVLFVTLNSIVLRTEKKFKNIYVCVLIYHFFEKEGPVDFLAGNSTPNQNFRIMQRLLYPIIRSII